MMKKLLLAFLAALVATAPLAQTLPTVPNYPNAITPRGPKGDIGCSVLRTSGAPAANVGKDCDFAIEPETGRWWGPKLGGQWGAPIVMSPVVAAQNFADRARFDAQQARSARANAEQAQLAAAQSAATASGAAASATTAAAQASQAASAASAVWSGGLLRFFASTADALSQGVQSLTITNGGNGGANGSFPLAFAGGGCTRAPSGLFTVANGGVVSTLIRDPGVGCTSDPTVSFAASAGLTGVAATVSRGINAPPGTYFAVVANDPSISHSVFINATAPGCAVAPCKVADVPTPLPAPPVTIDQNRRLAGADAGRLAEVNIPGPIANSIAHLRLPSNAQEPIPVGASFELVRRGGSAVRVVPEIGVTLAAPAQADLVNAFDWARLRKTGTNAWSMYGLLNSASPSALNAAIWLDPGDLSTLRVERTGDAATTQAVVNGPVGCARNKGTSSSRWFCADSDAQRPTLRSNGTRFWLEFDGNTATGQGDYLRLPAPALNLATIEMHLGMRIIGWQAGQSGVVTFAPTPIGVSSNDIFSTQGMAFFINGSDYSVVMRGGPTSSMILPETGIKPDAHLYEFRKPNNASATLTVNGLLTRTDNSITDAFTTQGGDLFIGVRFQNGQPISPGNFELHELIITNQVVADPAPLRAFMDQQIFGTLPQYPAITNLTQLNAARAALISQVFATRGGVIPTDVATLETVTNPVPSLANVASVQRLVIPGYPMRPRLFTPTGTPRNDVILFLCTGHDVGLTGNALADVPLQSALNRGVRVVTFVLPNGPDELTAGDPLEHETSMSPLSEWAGPVSIAINTLQPSFPSAAFHIAGISGGGFMATLAGATDVRLRSTSDFVGSLPDYVFLSRDWEQRLPGVTATFLDLYLLAASPSPRQHRHILYENDPVGFNRAAYNSRPPWDATLATMATALGGNYSLRWDDFNQHAFRNPFWTNNVLNEIAP